MHVKIAALLFSLLISLVVSIAHAAAHALERGVALTDPELMAELERHGFGLGELIQGRVGRVPSVPHSAPAGSALVEVPRPIGNANLFRIRALTPIARIVKAEIDAVPQQSLEPLVREAAKDSVKDGTLVRSKFRFDPAFLDHSQSRFVLTGIVNRMDRAYRTPQSCGEIRFIYRFSYQVASDEGADIESRLPLTLALVLKARGQGQRTSCAEIARRWLHAPGGEDAPAATAEQLRSPLGPLGLVNAAQIDRIELNMQVVRLPAAIKQDFGGHAEYLMKVFRWDPERRIFQESRLENQIDRERLLQNPDLLRRFKAFILRPESIRDLDRGTLVIPDRYLAFRAISISPGGGSRSQNRPFADLISDQEISDALRKYAAKASLQVVKSPQGLKARLNDLACAGCHQNRAIAGFHFIGADQPSEPATNAVFVPGSAHFFGDLPRRREVVEAFAAGRPPNFTRGFSARPLDRSATALADTQLLGGWGATCYVGNDLSFVGWTCRTGLSCKVLHGSSRHPGMGTCISREGPKIGDPLELGTVTSVRFGEDVYRRDVPPEGQQPALPTDRQDYVSSHQQYAKADKTGGFPAGMLRLKCCSKLPGEATCGLVAVNGFNDCLLRNNHVHCVSTFTDYAGLRACDQASPCRDDYICTAPIAAHGELSQVGQRTFKNACERPDASWLQNRRMGTCIPPYFMFQFRVDGHPRNFVDPEPVAADTPGH
jgi:hypothetical protein